MNMKTLYPTGPNGVCHPYNVMRFDLSNPACRDLYEAPDRPRTWSIWDGWEDSVLRHALFAKQAANCSTVQQCGLGWMFLTIGDLMMPGHNKHMPGGFIDNFQASLFEQITRRARRVHVKYLRDMYRERVAELKVADAETPPQPTPASSVTIGMHADEKSTQGLWRGQIQLWRAYAAAHGMRFELDKETYFDGQVFSKALGLFWVSESKKSDGFWQRYEFLQQGRAPFENYPRASPSFAYLKDKYMTDSLAIFSQPPLMWDSLEALGVVMKRNTWTVWMDYDLMLSPCCFDAFSFVELIDSTWSSNVPKNTVPHVIIRDSPKEDYHHHCANAGFVVVRNSAIGRLLLDLARAKRMWPGIPYGYQSALGEALLELLGMEQQLATDGSVTYDAKCMSEIAVGREGGGHSYARFCQCWRAELLRLAGPEGARTSRWVRFLDSRRGPETGLLVPSLHLYRGSAATQGGSGRNDTSRGFGHLALTDWSRARHRSYVDAWMPPDLELGGPCGVLPLMLHWASLPHRPRLIYEFLSERFPENLPLDVLVNGSVEELIAGFRGAAGEGLRALQRQLRLQAEQSGDGSELLIINGKSKLARRGACNLGSELVWQLGGFVFKGHSTDMAQIL
eukprot:TRINITY_DN123623_c0_g1_i1.p1 TRINITY_DN123623_c0_g1~~TRINITY_DN123623_c0_g1_i1.p1  ORF type:complete len:622 (-),score=124.27 TRINITY_DN123623_c0_g1_i1:505-2370(-)